MIDDGNTLSSYLSENVYEVVVNLRTSISPTTCSCFTQDCLLNWPEIDIALGTISDCNILGYSQEWFTQKNKLLWSVINAVGENFMISLKENKINVSHLSFWFDDSKDSEDILNKFLSKGDNELLLCLLVLTSRTERVLGNIYAACGKEVPFLLKDLLASDILRQKLGKTQVIFLQLLLGCVHGLNLRNIAWHGFFSPMELHQDLVATLLLTLISLGDQLKDLEILRRPYLNHEYKQNHGKLLMPFYSSIFFDEEHFIKMVTACTYVSKNYEYWIYCFHQFQSGSLGYSLMFLMPLLENLLRSIYCSANKCPERMLTAESTVFYTTLDDILTHTTPYGENQIINVIGERVFEMLLDLFLYQEGPRLRDKISHAEIILGDIPEAMGKHTFGVVTSLILSISNGNETFDEHFLQFLQVPQQYESIYHPGSLLKSDLLSVIQNVKTWTNLPTPSEMSFSTNDKDCISLKNSSSKITGLDFSDSSDIMMVITTNLAQTYLLTLFRPKYELELISLLRKIAENINQLSQNVSSSIQIKYGLWHRKAMKSRERDNYRRMIYSVPLIMHTMANILFLISITLTELYQMEEKKIKNIQRFFKTCLKFVENGVTLSSIKRNRWNELRESSINICNESIEKFSLIFQHKNNLDRN